MVLFSTHILAALENTSRHQYNPLTKSECQGLLISLLNYLSIIVRVLRSEPSASGLEVAGEN
jgi:hypothetical protein